MELLHSLPPYTFCGGPKTKEQFNKAKVAILPVPFDGATSYKSGSRDGPAAIIMASRFLEHYEIELDVDATKEVGFYTLDELAPVRGDAKATIERLEKATEQVYEWGKFPLMLGGDHSLTIGSVRAVAKKFPPEKLSVLTFDAHADWWDEYEDSDHSHACTGSRIADITPSIGKLHVNEVIVGPRSINDGEIERAKKAGVEIVYSFDFNKQSFKEILEKRILPKLRENVYISFDVDGLDPSIMPSTGTPEPEGISWRQAVDIISAVSSKRKVIGADVVEFSPIPGFHGPDFLAAKLAHRIATSAIIRK